MPDEPIVVTGGSVTIDFSENYQPEPKQPGKHKHKHQHVKLVHVEVNGTKVADLQPNDVVTIVCR
jgi:hypothetical protein